VTKCEQRLQKCGIRQAPADMSNTIKDSPIMPRIWQVYSDGEGQRKGAMKAASFMKLVLISIFYFAYYYD